MVAQTPSRTHNKEGDKHTAIIQAARELFAEQGYEATTIAQVAKKAGVAVGTVYLYFKNKPELLYGVKCDFEYLFVEYLQNADLQGIPHHQRIRPLMQTIFDMGRNVEQMIQMMGLPPQLLGFSPKTSTSPIISAIETFIGDGIEAGAFRPVDSHISAVISFNMVHGAMEACANEGGGAHQHYVDTLVEALERWILRPEHLDLCK